MSKRMRVVMGALVAVVCLSRGMTAEEKTKAPAAKAPAKASGGKAILMAADELKWMDPKGAPAGVKMAVLWGDPEKGPHGAMHKFPAGFAAPLHYHSAGHKVFVISGTLLLTPEGEAEKKLGPGSYFSFTGKKKHVTKCDAGAECILAVDCGGAWDVVMADAAKKDDAKKEEPKK